MSRFIIDTDIIEMECLNVVHPRRGSRLRSRVTLFLGDHLLYWKSQRQALVAWSATEAEVEATAIAFQDGLKLHAVLSELVGSQVPVAIALATTTAAATSYQLQQLLQHTRLIAITKQPSPPRPEAVSVSSAPTIKERFGKAIRLSQFSTPLKLVQHLFCQT